MATQTLQLPCGDKVPMLAYGTGTVWMKSAEDDVDRATVDAIKEAIDLGYRHLDGAQCISPVSPSSLCRKPTNAVEQDYETEPELGLAIEESKVPRAEFFVTMKAVSPIDVEGALVTSLKKLRMEYVDLYLIHEPFSSGGSEEVLQEAWRGMERCREKGLARSIGVSNFLIPHLESILKVATVKPAVNQIECHPYLQRSELREFMKRQGIIAEAFAPLTPITKASPGPIDAVCGDLARKYSVSNSTILLRWVIDQGIVVITTSGQRKRLLEYLEQLSRFKLSNEEILRISQLGRAKHYRAFFVDGFGKDCFL
ncbi:unnamed protein product [Clonostachys rhizophaga]|uniref:NADP-dependent oxidoreductase domain-containing protein n=1 Tax=Clonostachys rhizophaga TaxID=160324 RepID=A0A9N9VLX3_9HYPO|nr:unnamed protein product [Clonostachys rhizophaga]